MYVLFEESSLKILRSAFEVFTDKGWKRSEELRIGDRVRDLASDPCRPRWLIVRGWT